MAAGRAAGGQCAKACRCGGRARRRRRIRPAGGSGSPPAASPSASPSATPSSSTPTASATATATGTPSATATAAPPPTPTPTPLTSVNCPEGYAASYHRDGSGRVVCYETPAELERRRQATAARCAAYHAARAEFAAASEALTAAQEAHSALGSEWSARDHARMGIGYREWRAQREAAAAAIQAAYQRFRAAQEAVPGFPSECGPVY